MHTYVLIVTILGNYGAGHAAIVTQEFHNKETCMKAAEIIARENERYHTYCFEK